MVYLAKLRVQARENDARSPTMGMGLCLQRRLSIFGDRLVGPVLDPCVNTLIRYPASSDHTARLWDMASGETVRQYNGHQKGTGFLCARRGLC